MMCSDSRGLDKKELIVISYMIFIFAFIKTYVMDTQKNRLTETILLSTHNIGFGGQMRILEHEKRSLSTALVCFVTASGGLYSVFVIHKCYT